MMQHLKIKKRGCRYRGLAAGNGVCVGLKVAAPNVARVSFVQGSVQLLAGQGTNFQQAVMNMPVLDGSRLQTGGDGQAEVEFGDGSVARLTPTVRSSSITWDRTGFSFSSCLV